MLANSLRVIVTTRMDDIMKVADITRADNITKADDTTTMRIDVQKAGKGDRGWQRPTGGIGLGWADKSRDRTR